MILCQFPLTNIHNFSTYLFVPDMYTIEFQKRGLPRAHILIFLHPSRKYPTPSDIDQIISAEIPHQDDDPELYNLVKSHMIHGPCGKANGAAPCTKDGKCTKYFPKNFEAETIVDQDGFSVYRRRNNGNTITKNGIHMDNRYAVPYNPKLLLKYQAHINMEWCNQSTSIKYLFKYINKGYDRIVAAIVPTEDGNGNQQGYIDEIKHYIDCRYVSPSEACWRIYSFPIHGRKPAVERLFFHCEGDNSIYYKDYEKINDALLKPSVAESMFTAWFEANKKYPEARELTYRRFVSMFVYVKKKREWKPREKGYTIGRLMWVPPCTGELYYLRIMLTHVKGPLSYNNIKIVKNILYDSFRDACFAMGFVGDDKEYISAIKEANPWGSGHFLRKLFVTLLLSSSMNRPHHVWYNTWRLLADGILYAQQRLANNRGTNLNGNSYILKKFNLPLIVTLIFFLPDLRLTDEEIFNLILIEIERHLQKNRKSLKDYPGMPYPNGYVAEQLGNRFIYEERAYNHNEQLQEFNGLYRNLTGMCILLCSLC